MNDITGEGARVAFFLILWKFLYELHADELHSWSVSRGGIFMRYTLRIAQWRAPANWIFTAMRVQRRNPTAHSVYLTCEDGPNFLTS